jgi:hypothetical protein
MNKKYKLVDTESSILCKIKDRKGWYVKYSDTYITFKGKNNLIKRFTKAMEEKGYIKISSKDKV